MATVRGTARVLTGSGRPRADDPLEGDALHELADEVGTPIGQLAVHEHRDRLQAVELHGGHHAALVAERRRLRRVARLDEPQHDLAVEMAVVGEEYAPVLPAAERTDQLIPTGDHI